MNGLAIPTPQSQTATAPTVDAARCALGHNPTIPHAAAPTAARLAGG